MEAIVREVIEVCLRVRTWLNKKARRWYKIVDDACQKFGQYDKVVQACDLQLLKSENAKRAWKSVKDVQLDDLPNQMARAKGFKHRLQTVRIFVQ